MGVLACVRVRLRAHVGANLISPRPPELGPQRGGWRSASDGAGLTCAVVFNYPAGEKHTHARHTRTKYKCKTYVYVNKKGAYTVGTYSPGKLSVVYEMSMHVLPTVPSPTTTHLMGRPDDMAVTV